MAERLLKTDLSLLSTHEAPELHRDLAGQYHNNIALGPMGMRYSDSSLSHFFISVGPPYTFRMRIKFYSSEPNNLREEITRYSKSRDFEPFK